MIYWRIESPTTWFHDSLKQMKHLQKPKFDIDTIDIYNFSPRGWPLLFSPRLEFQGSNDATSTRGAWITGDSAENVSKIQLEKGIINKHHASPVSRVADLYYVYIDDVCILQNIQYVHIHIWLYVYICMYLKNQNQSSDWFKSKSALACRWFFEFRHSVAMELHGIVSVSLLLAWLVNPFFRKYIIYNIHTLKFEFLFSRNCLPTVSIYLTI